MQPFQQSLLGLHPDIGRVPPQMVEQPRDIQKSVTEIPKGDRRVKSRLIAHQQRSADQ